MKKLMPMFALGTLVTGLGACAGNQATPAKDASPKNTEKLAVAKKAGYTPAMRDGEVVYCRTDLKTGSHVERETVCLTEDEMRAVTDQSQETMREISRHSTTPFHK